MGGREQARPDDESSTFLDVIVGIGSDLDLDATLDRIVTAAIQLTGADYGALAVRGVDRVMLSFIHHGVAPEAAARIGHLPVGKGILGVPLEHVPALRLADLADHPAAAGFPPQHPPMHAFLGVPIDVRGTVFGSLYLTHGSPGVTFDEADEVAARTLASAAAVAIDNAQLFERVRTSARWADAGRELTTALLSGTVTDPLRLVAERASDLLGAHRAVVLLPDGEPATHVVLAAQAGAPAGDGVGSRIPIDLLFDDDATARDVLESTAPLLTDGFADGGATDTGQALVLPLRTPTASLGVLVLSRAADGSRFGADLLDLAADFGQHAALALDLAAARDRESALTVLADRERIAHDLHDHVIQRLFAAGLDLQGTIARSQAPEIDQRLSRTLDDLQSIVETIRSTIFDLRPPAGRPDLRARLSRVVTDLVADHGIATTVRVSGPTDGLTDQVAEHAEAVVTEAVSNVLRHAHATRLTVTATVADDVVLEVRDDGVGIPADNVRRSGLANMARRAELLGGRCTVGTATETTNATATETATEAGTGTCVRWTVPLR